MEHRSECCNTGYVNTCDVLVWFGIRIAFVGVTIWRARGSRLGIRRHGGMTHGANTARAARIRGNHVLTTGRGLEYEDTAG